MQGECGSAGGVKCEWHSFRVKTHCSSPLISSNPLPLQEAKKADFCPLCNFLFLSSPPPLPLALPSSPSCLSFLPRAFLRTPGLMSSPHTHTHFKEFTLKTDLNRKYTNNNRFEYGHERTQDLVRSDVPFESGCHNRAHINPRRAPRGFS